MYRLCSAVRKGRPRPILSGSGPYQIIIHWLKHDLNREACHYILLEAKCANFGSGGMASVFCRYINTPALKKIMKKLAFDCVYHLGSVRGVRAHSRKPVGNAGGPNSTTSDRRMFFS